MITIGIADDRPLIRRGLRHVFSAAPDLEVVLEVESGFELLKEIQECPCDVLVLDVSMPGPGFSETLVRLTKHHPDVGVLVLTMHPEDQYALRALREGARGYLTKDVHPEELLQAVRRIASGGRYLSPSLGELLVHGLLAEGEQPRHAELSDREFEVLRLVGAGLSSVEIAARLSISPKTVGTYRGRIREKLNLSSTTAMIRYAIEEGLSGSSVRD